MKRILIMIRIKNEKKRRFFALAMTVITVIALALSLTACGGCGGNSEKVTIDTQGKNESDMAFIAKVIASNENYKLRFLAASRGYDISPREKEEKLQDIESADVKGDPAVGVEAGKKVIDLILENFTFENSEDKTVLEDYKATLTITTMELVVAEENFKQSYDLETSNGFPTILLVWIGKFLGWLTKLFGGHYILAIMVFAVIIEIVMLPVAIKQQKNAIGMAKLRPAMAKIEKKYAGRNDPATLQKKREEMTALQQKEGYSPFSGCLPMLLQLIIVGFILYPIIQNPLKYMLNQSEGFSSALLYYATSPLATGGLGMEISSRGNVIELLSHLDISSMEGIKSFALIQNGAEIFTRFEELLPNMPKFMIFGSINLGEVPSFTSILILVPILNVVAQWLTTFLTKRWNNTGYNNPVPDGQSAASMKIMEYIPLAMTLWILFKIPALIGVYWLFRSAISLGKQFIMKLVLPVPKFTDEEIAELEKLEKERQKAQKAALKAQPKTKSLHYIDEEDYEELPEVESNKSAKKPASEAPEIKD